MSGLPEMTGGVDLESLKEGYVDLVILREHFCTYKGQCKIDRVTSNGFCLYCVYRNSVKIPELIDRLIEEKRRKREEENAGKENV
jgi:hypothetical protein